MLRRSGACGGRAVSINRWRTSENVGGFVDGLGLGTLFGTLVDTGLRGAGVTLGGVRSTFGGVRLAGTLGRDAVGRLTRDGARLPDARDGKLEPRLGIEGLGRDFDERLGTLVREGLAGLLLELDRTEEDGRECDARLPACVDALGLWPRPGSDFDGERAGAVIATNSVLHTAKTTALCPPGLRTNA